MLGHYQDAEDATQETFARVLRHLARWDQNRAFEPWLLTIASNRCRTALSLRRKRPVAQPLVNPVPDSASDQYRLNNLIEEISFALDRLRPEYRRAFELFHNDAYSYVEIAQRLRCPVGTVKTWVHRARRELIEHLKKRQVVDI
jgi:RNA polymerase sigma-70 factor (ECF subfamily)